MKSRQAAVIFIFITVVLDMLAIGLIAPVLPKLVLSFLNNDMRRAANWNGIFLTVFAAMQFFFSPVIGVLSDRIGRRPVLLLSSLGLGLDYVVMALAPTIGWLFLGRIISGITASSIPTAMAYIADVTPREKRAGAFGLIGAAFGIGFTFGPVVGGLVGNTNPRMAFWVASAFSLANWLYGFFFVPESLPKDKRKEFSWRRANPVGSLVLLRSHPDLWKLATIQFLAYVSHEIFAIWALYAIYSFAWGPRSIGNSLFVVGVCTAVISAGLTGRIVAWLGERRTLYVGQFFGAVGMLIAGLARNERGGIDLDAPFVIHARSGRAIVARAPRRASGAPSWRRRAPGTCPTACPTDRPGCRGRRRPRSRRAPRRATRSARRWHSARGTRRR